MNPWAEPFEKFFSEYSEQALMFIKKSFQTTALVWIPSLGKKPDLQSGKNRFAMEKAIRSGLKNIALRAGLKG